MKRNIAWGGALVAAMVFCAPHAYAAAPVVSGIASTTTNTTASITFNTDVLATTAFQVGTTTAYGTTIVDVASTTHAFGLSLLSYGTTYHFRIIATNATSTETATSSDYTFMTTSDFTPPVITVTASTTATSTFSIAFNTNEPSTASFRYGTTTTYGTTLLDTLLPSHAFGVSGLSSGTTYHFLMTATDASGNTASTTDATFTTLPAPTIIGLASTTNATSTVVSFTTNVPANVLFQFGTTTAYGSSIVDAATTTHSFYYSNLMPSTTYHFHLVVADSSTGASTSTPDYTVRTIADIIPPVLSGVADGYTSTYVVFDWETDKYTTSYAALGTTTAYTIATSSAALQVGHALYIYGLIPSTLYHFIYSSTDAYGNTATSSDMTFTTSAAPAPTPTMSPTYSGGFHGGGSGGGSSTLNTATKTALPMVTTAPTTTSATTLANPTLQHDLMLGVTSTDVLFLQRFLNAHGAIIAPSGVGSSGNESTYFGVRTKKALIAYQKAHGILPASGYFGPLTRAYIAAHS